jgi:hypothetical protein
VVALMIPEKIRFLIIIIRVKFFARHSLKAQHFNSL